MRRALFAVQGYNASDLFWSGKALGFDRAAPLLGDLGLVRSVLFGNERHHGGESWHGSSRGECPRY